MWDRGQRQTPKYKPYIKITNLSSNLKNRFVIIIIIIINLLNSDIIWWYPFLLDMCRCAIQYHWQGTDVPKRVFGGIFTKVTFPSSSLYSNCYVGQRTAANNKYKPYIKITNLSSNLKNRFVIIIIIIIIIKLISSDIIWWSLLLIRHAQRCKTAPLAIGRCSHFWRYLYKGDLSVVFSTRIVMWDRRRHQST